MDKKERDRLYRLRPENLEKEKARGKWRAANRTPEEKERRRVYERNRFKSMDARVKFESWVEKNWNMSVEDYARLANKQNLKCPICTQDLTFDLFTVVDHCHKSEKIRGLIHRQCNSGIGFLGDDVDTLKRAVEYLERANVGP